MKKIKKPYRNIRLLSWFNFFLDLRFYYPIAIIYFSKVTGSFTLGMSIFSISMLSSTLFELPTGLYSDIIGRKKTMVWGAGMSLVSIILYAIGGSFTFLSIGAVVEGIARSFYSGNNEAFLYDTLSELKKEKEYSQYLGTTSSKSQWAAASSALLGGIIASISFSLVMWLSVIPAVFGLITTFFMIEPKIHKEETTNIYAHIKEALKIFKNNHRLRTLSITKMIGYAQGEAGFQFNSAFVATLWPLWAIGLYRIIANIGAALSFHYSGRILKRFGNFKMIIAGKSFSLATKLIAYSFPTILSPILLSSSSVFFGTGRVGMSNLLQSEYSTKQRSTMGSLNSLFGSLAFAIIALGLGLFADNIGPAKSLLLTQIFAVFALYTIWKLFKKKS